MHLININLKENEKVWDPKRFFLFPWEDKKQQTPEQMKETFKLIAGAFSGHKGKKRRKPKPTKIVKRKS